MAAAQTPAIAGDGILRAALVQFLADTSVGATSTNLVRMGTFVARAASAGARLIVFPELATCGYGCSASALRVAIEQETLVLEVRQFPKPAIILHFGFIY
jgi:predicted amidohydrolase